MELAECGMKYPHSSCIHPVNRRRDSGKCLVQPPRSNFGLHIANIPNKKQIQYICNQVKRVISFSLSLSLVRNGNFVVPWIGIATKEGFGWRHQNNSAASEINGIIRSGLLYLNDRRVVVFEDSDSAPKLVNSGSIFDTRPIFFFFFSIQRNLYSEKQREMLSALPLYE